MRSSKRKIFLKENKRKKILDLVKTYQLACRSPFLSHVQTSRKRCSHLLCQLHTQIHLLWNPGPTEANEFFVIGFNEAKITCYGSGLFFLSFFVCSFLFSFFLFQMFTFTGTVLSGEHSGNNVSSNSYTIKCFQEENVLDLKQCLF